MFWGYGSRVLGFKVSKSVYVCLSEWIKELWIALRLYREWLSYIDDSNGATASSREELDHFITCVNSFHPALINTWEISETSIAFLDLCAPVCTTNLQIPTVICYIHLLILPTSKTLTLSLSFLDLDVYVVMTPIFPTNHRKWAISSRSVAILILLSTRLNTVFNRLIDSQHIRRHRRKSTENSIYTHLLST